MEKKQKVDHDYAIDSYISGSVWEGRNQSKFSMMSSVQAITSSTIGTSWKKQKKVLNNRFLTGNNMNVPTPCTLGYLIFFTHKSSIYNYLSSFYFFYYCKDVSFCSIRILAKVTVAIEQKKLALYFYNTHRLKRTKIRNI